MKELEDKILSEGEVYPGNILKVGSFLNHQLDVDFLMKMGKEISELFEAAGITKILTIEASGIAIAVPAGYFLHVPVIFAKKGQAKNLSGQTYSTKVKSFTHGNLYDVAVSKEYLKSTDTVLLIDDFLANGNALNGLIDLVNQAGASLAGAAIAIEKGFQGGGDALRNKGIRVESLAIVDNMDNNTVVFRS